MSPRFHFALDISFVLMMRSAAVARRYGLRWLYRAFRHLLAAALSTGIFAVDTIILLAAASFIRGIDMKGALLHRRRFLRRCAMISASFVAD